MLALETLNFDKGNGLVTVVTVDAASGAVLMVAHADRDALERTLATGEMHYHSRTRGAWHKGATSGHVQRVVSLTADCDGDAVLARVLPAGPACHTGTVSCFGERASTADVLSALDRVLAERAAEPWGGTQDTGPRTRSLAGGAPPEGPAEPRPPSHTRRLLADRNLRIKKLGEEATELALACADEDPARAAEEGADVIYHTLVALRALGVSLDDVRRVLAARAASR